MGSGIEFYVSYKHSRTPSTKDDTKKGKPVFLLLSFVSWHDIEASYV